VAQRARPFRGPRGGRAHPARGPEVARAEPAKLRPFLRPTYLFKNLKSPSKIRRRGPFFGLPAGVNRVPDAAHKRPCPFDLRPEGVVAAESWPLSCLIGF